MPAFLLKCLKCANIGFFRPNETVLHPGTAQAIGQQRGAEIYEQFLSYQLAKCSERCHEVLALDLLQLRIRDLRNLFGRAATLRRGVAVGVGQHTDRCRYKGRLWQSISA